MSRQLWCVNSISVVNPIGRGKRYAEEFVQKHRKLRSLRGMLKQIWPLFFRRIYNVTYLQQNHSENMICFATGMKRVCVY